MRHTKSNRTELLLGIILCLSLTILAAGPGDQLADKKGAQFVPFEAFDLWDFGDPAQLIEYLKDGVSCPGSEFTFDLEQPCPPGTNLKMRNLMAPGRLISSDPRMTGTAYWNFNGNLNPEYTGPVWGTWILYVEGDEGVWEGTWSGKRILSVDPSMCYGFPFCWIGELELVGHGSGGLVDGLQVKATDIVRTFSALPAPYENICLMAFGGPCPLQDIPEGFVSGRILEPGSGK
jgi:hypothetical protein